MMYNVCIHHVDCHFYNIYLYSCAKRDECSLSLMLSCSVDCPIYSQSHNHVCSWQSERSVLCMRADNPYVPSIRVVSRSQTASSPPFLYTDVIVGPVRGEDLLRKRPPAGRTSSPKAFRAQVQDVSPSSIET